MRNILNAERLGRQWASGSLLLIAALFLLGACAAGRLTSPPPGFRLKSKRVQLQAQGKTETAASAPFFNMSNMGRLDGALKSINFRRLVNQNLYKGIPGKLWRFLTRRGGRSRFKLYVHLEKADVMQPIIGADWYLRMNVLCTLMDVKTGTELWKYRLREVSGVEMNGRKLKSLSTDQLVARGARRLKSEAAIHFRKVLKKVMGDLLKALREARKAN